MGIRPGPKGWHNSICEGTGERAGLRKWGPQSGSSSSPACLPVAWSLLGLQASLIPASLSPKWQWPQLMTHTYKFIQTHVRCCIRDQWVSGVVVHAGHPSTEEAGTRGSQAQGQPGLHSKTVRACLKNQGWQGGREWELKEVMGREREGGEEGQQKEEEGGEDGRQQDKAIWKKMSAKRHWGKCTWEWVFYGRQTILLNNLKS